MKKLILSLFLCMFLFSFVSAYDFDNVKNFNPNKPIKGEIEIKNALGLGSTLATYIITKHTDQCLIDCYTEGIATFYSNDKLFRDVKFYDIYNNEKILPFKVYLEEDKITNWNENTYTQNCSNQLVNGTTKEVCNQIINGSIAKSRTDKVWVEYDSKTLEVGSYSWRIEVKKSPKEVIDWVGESFGVEFSEWAWYNSSWSNRKTINITGGASTLTNFPIFLNISYDSDMQVDFDDIAFVDGVCSGSQTTQIPYEIDNKVNSNYAQVWVRIPSLTTGINQICMYYNDPLSGSQQDKANVWSNNYTAVWHFGEGSGTTYADSLGRANFSNKIGTPTWVSGSSCSFGSCLRFDGNDDIQSIYDSVYQTTPIFLEQFANNTGGADQMSLCLPATDDAWNSPWIEACLYGNSNRQLDYNVGGTPNPATQLTFAYSQSTIGYEGMGFDGSTCYGAMHDKNYKSSNCADGSITYYNRKVRFGSREGTAGFWNGNGDEMRISKVMRDSSWINRTADNTNFALFAFGAEESQTGITIINSHPVNGVNITSSRLVSFGCNVTSSGQNISSVVLNASFGIQTISSLATLSYNATFNRSLSNGVYTWNCIGYGSLGINSSSSIQSFNLTYNKTIPSSMNITGTTPIKHHDVSDFVGVGCPSELVCSLIPTNKAWSVGNYDFNYSTVGNENYTAHSVIKTLSVIKDSFSLYLNVTTPISYGVLSDFVGYGCPSGLTCSLNLSNSIFAVGSISANYSFAGDINHSSNSTVKTLVINKASPSLSISGTTPIIYGIMTDVSGSGCPSQLTCSLDRNNSVYGVGNYSFNYSTAGNSNYTAHSVNKTIVINKASPSLSISGTTPIIYGTMTDVSGSGCPSQLTCSLSPANASNFTAGIHSFNYSTAGNENYTSAQVFKNISVVFLNPISVYISFPLNDRTYNFNNPLNATSFVFSITNVSLSLDTCEYSLNNGSTKTSFDCSSPLENVSYNEGRNIWCIYANDTANNQDYVCVDFDIYTPQSYPLFLALDFEGDKKWVNIALLMVLILATLLLLYFGWLLYASFLLLMIGFVILFSELSVFIASLFIIAGVLVAFIRSKL